MRKIFFILAIFGLCIQKRSIYSHPFSSYLWLIIFIFIEVCVSSTVPSCGIYFDITSDTKCVVSPHQFSKTNSVSNNSVLTFTTQS